MKQLLFIFLFLFCYQNSFAQIIIHQDTYYGGVTGDAFDPWLSWVTGELNVHIEPGSTIRKAYLFSNSYNKPTEEGIIYFDGTPILVSSDMNINQPYYFYSSNIREIQTQMIDVTALINPTQSTYTISVDSPTPVEFFAQFYLYISYENPTLSKVNSVVVANDIQPNTIMNYPLSHLNLIDTSKNVGLAIHTSDFCDTIQDGSYILIESDTIGLLGGEDIHGPTSCNGVAGSFYYQNNTLFALGNDIPNNSMEATDGIANIEPFLISYNSIDITFIYQSNIAPRSNPVHQLFLTYTSPCDTFPSSLTADTTICAGDIIQLEATGGQNYEWTAATNPSTGLNDLSCSTCPNPVFTGDSSQVYTVRIWNNENCSVVKSVNIRVSQSEEIKTDISPTLCGASTGKITIIEEPHSAIQIACITPAGDVIQANSNNEFTNLSAGEHIVFYVNKSGCIFDTLIHIDHYKNTIAQFEVSPHQGAVPVDFVIDNLSQNSSDYSWWLNDEYQGNTFSGFHTDTSGIYEITLIAWINDSICADTTSTTIIALDNLILNIPNVFTPNNDGINDFFKVNTNIPASYKLSILNRWGNIVFEKEDYLNIGEHILWNGYSKSNNLVNDGTYFYIIDLHLDEEKLDCNLMNCVIKKEGFVQVFGK